MKEGVFVLLASVNDIALCTAVQQAVKGANDVFEGGTRQAYFLDRLVYVMRAIPRREALE